MSKLSELIWQSESTCWQTLCRDYPNKPCTRINKPTTLIAEPCLAYVAQGFKKLD